MMEAVYVKATCRAMADQPHRGGRGLVKEKEDPAKETFDRTALA